jgi:Acetyltransferase (GNAT) domain
VTVTIRRIVGDHELRSVLKQRFNVYHEELGYPLPVGVTGDLEPEALDSRGTIFGAFAEDTVIGSVRLNYGAADDPDGGFGVYTRFYDLRHFHEHFPHNLVLVTRLVMAPTHRGGSMLQQFAIALYEHTRQEQPDVRFCIIDCIPKLQAMFERIGYRQIGPWLDHPMAGPVVQMAFAVYDLHHFQRVRSPLARVCPRHDPDSAAWLDTRFPLTA